MWNNFGDITKRLAEKAAAAAENIEGQLNQSVGATPDVLAANANKTLSLNDGNAFDPPPNASNVDEDPFYDDDFYGDGDEDDSFDVDMHKADELEEHPANPDGTKVQEQELTGGIAANDQDLDPKIENSEDKDFLIDSGIPRTIRTDHDAHSSDQSDNIQEEDLYGDVGDCEEEKEANDEYFAAPMQDNIDGGNEVVTDAIRSGKGASAHEHGENDEITRSIKEEQPRLHESRGSNEISSSQTIEAINADSKNIEHEIDATPTIVNDKLLEVDIDQDSVLRGDNIVEIETKGIDVAEIESAPITETDSDLEIVIDSDLEIDPHALVDEEVDAESNVSNPVKNNAEFGISSELQMDDSGEDQISEEGSTHQGTPEPLQIRSAKSTSSSEEISVYVSREEANSIQDDRSRHISSLESQIEELMKLLTGRENQLASKCDQMSTMVEMFELEKKALEVKVKDTKEEAKKRVGKAKEKVNSMQTRLSEANERANSSGDASRERDQIIVALRTEGENLARKQSEMEKLVREARGEMREIQSDLMNEKSEKEIAQETASELESQVKELKKDLASAREKGGLAEKLDSDLLAAREEREKNASAVLELQAELKEVKSSTLETQQEMEQAFKDKVSQMEHQNASTSRENDAILKDLEVKLRTSEREANMREDSLRHELAELRKRWQESVRRCDALSIDLQQSSAPLMRQLESTEKQSRARAAAWAELETRIRSDLDDNVTRNEKLRKEKMDLETNLIKIQRNLQETQSQLNTNCEELDAVNQSLKEESRKFKAVSKELEALELNFARMEQIMENNNSKVRLELTNNFQETEERHIDHIESLGVELRQEKEKRSVLEKKIKEMMLSPETLAAVTNVKPEKKRNLSKAANQVDILNDTLLGLDDNDDSSDEYEEREIASSATGSFAFIEQLSQALKASKLERETLRNQLDDSEERRSVLENETIINREAAKKLQETEKQTSDLSNQVMEKDREIQNLQEDILEVRQMYRTQLDALLGEVVEAKPAGDIDGVPKASSQTSETKSKSPVVPTSFVGMRTF